MLALHCIQETLALGFLQLFHIPGNEITPDPFMKFLGYQEANTKKQYHIYAPYYFGAEVHLTFLLSEVLTRLVNISTFTLVQDIL